MPTHHSILGIMQARMSSKRLPGKVLKPLLGIPMFLRQIERIKRSKKIEELIIATSVDETDDAIVNVCKAQHLKYFRGSLHDVLDRYYQAAIRHEPKHVVRLTADCPLTDPIMIDTVIDYHIHGHYDYTNNFLTPTYPYGLDAEIMTLDALKLAWQEAKLPSEREHVTLFLYQHPKRFRIGHVKNDKDLSHLRFAVDEPDDFLFINTIYEALYPKNSAFTTDDILDFLDKNPTLTQLNSHFNRYAGLEKSFLEDQAYT